MSNDSILHTSNLEFIKFKYMKTKFKPTKKITRCKMAFYPRYDTQPASKEDKSAFISYLHSQKPNGILKRG